MKLFSLVTLALGTLSALASAQDKLQIGVLRSVPAEQCLRKTANGDKLAMHYRGTLKETGTEFDASYNRNQEFEFTLGQGMVIKGWVSTIVS